MNTPCKKANEYYIGQKITISNKSLWPTLDSRFATFPHPIDKTITQEVIVTSPTNDVNEFGDYIQVRFSDGQLWWIYIHQIVQPTSAKHEIQRKILAAMVKE